MAEEVRSALRAMEEGAYNTEMGELLWWSYYDTLLLEVATLEYSFFSTPLGQGGKTKAETNFPAANQMPQAQKLEVRAIELFYIPQAAKSQAEAQNIINAFRTGWLEFDFTNKAPLVQLPLPQLMGAAFPIIVSGAAAGDQAYGRSEYTGVWESPVEIILPAKSNFSVNIVFNTALDASLEGDKLQISLVGGLVRL